MAKEKDPPQNADILATSEIEQEMFTFSWSINNFSAFSINNEIKSPVFHGGPKSNHSWQLQVNPKKKFDDYEYLCIFLNLLDFGNGKNDKNRSIKVRFQINIQHIDGTCKIQRGGPTQLPSSFVKMNGFGFNKFILSSELFNPRRQLLPNDSLNIHCKIWILGDEKHHLSSINPLKRKRLSMEQQLKRRKEDLAIDFGKIFTHSVLTDIAIMTSHNTFMAHKAILAARSSVFEAMFNANMVEKEMNSVEIYDFEDEIVKAMLEYVYTGETDLMAERASDLLQVAEKYDLAGLKEDCENTLSENLSDENAANVFVMAQTYNAKLLTHRVIEYINCNKENLKKSKTFQQVVKAHPSIFVDLYLSE